MRGGRASEFQQTVGGDPLRRWVLRSMARVERSEALRAVRQRSHHDRDRTGTCHHVHVSCVRRRRARGIRSSRGSGASRPNRSPGGSREERAFRQTNARRIRNRALARRARCCLIGAWQVEVLERPALGARPLLRHVGRGPHTGTPRAKDERSRAARAEDLPSRGRRHRRRCLTGQRDSSLSSQSSQSQSRARRRSGQDARGG